MASMTRLGPKPATTETATIPAQGKTSTDLLNDFFTSMAPQQSVNQDANGVSSAKAAGKYLCGWTCFVVLMLDQNQV